MLQNRIVETNGQFSSERQSRFVRAAFSKSRRLGE
jgi:hypothetical protein